MEEGDLKIKKFMNAKIELSVEIQNLTKIAEFRLRTFEINSHDSTKYAIIQNKLAQLEKATKTARTLVKYF